jgi:hypothetical protein
VAASHSRFLLRVPYPKIENSSHGGGCQIT